mmetsp:Transcript_7406/g.15890  ORF Transcript_7406/g.15890 Transcript_7406/m.15890 type:complete len:238 (+) Transcript_7406:307-1020(+)
MNTDNNFRCQIKRSERPCLVCSGHMDLIEARPSRLNFFGGIPLVCSSEGVDCLDCPKCGFKTTTTDYEYLRMCKRSRQVKGTFADKTTNSGSNGGTSQRSKKRSSRHRRENSNSSAFGNERSCPSCHASLESSSWHFCPKCGKSCSTSTFRRVSTSTSIADNIIEITIPKTVSKELVISDDDNNTAISNNNSFSLNHSSEEHNSSISTDSGIIRMVTPPKGVNISECSMNSPVEMQY